jgi:F-type H+-transporting ATPase subunit epsilon
MAVLFPFEVHTPYRRFYSGQVEAAILTLIDGEVCIYANHSAVTAPICTGLLKIKDSGGVWKTAFIAEGIIEVKEHKTVIMSDSAEWPNEIDIDRARKAKEEAEKVIKEGSMKFDIENAAASLKKAEMRIKAWETGQGN